MSDIISEQWIERWKDKNIMKEENWYNKYQLSVFYSRFINLISILQKIALLRDTKSKFVIWYFEHFIPNHL